MRLYVNTKEVPFLKEAIQCQILRSGSAVANNRLSDLLERIELCEALQKSERRARKEDQEEIKND